MCQIKPGENVAARIRLCGKLDKKGGEEVSDMLLPRSLKSK